MRTCRASAYTQRLWREIKRLRLSRSVWRTPVSGSLLPAIARSHIFTAFLSALLLFAFSPAVKMLHADLKTDTHAASPHFTKSFSHPIDCICSFSSEFSHRGLPAIVLFKSHSYALRNVYFLKIALPFTKYRNCILLI